MFFFDKRKKILLSYSWRHFHPVIKSKKEFTSAGQIAKNLYYALKDDYKVYYNDNPLLIRKADLILSPYIHRLHYIKAPVRISFPVIAHPEYRNRVIQKEAEKAGEKSPEYIFSEKELADFNKGFKDSNLIILVGNNYVKETYIKKRGG